MPQRYASRRRLLFQAEKTAHPVQPSAKPVVFTVRAARHAVSLVSLRVRHALDSVILTFSFQAPPVLKSTVAPIALTAFNAVYPVPLRAIGFHARRGKLER